MKTVVVAAVSVLIFIQSPEKLAAEDLYWFGAPAATVAGIFNPFNSLFPPDAYGPALTYTYAYPDSYTRYRISKKTVRVFNSNVGKRRALMR